MKNMMCVGLLLASSISWSQTIERSPREKAKILYGRLTGVKPSKAEINKLEPKIAAGNIKGAALDIIDQKGGINNGGAFYGVTLKTMVTPWFNEDGTSLAPLDDAIATIIGFVRDERAFNTILYENVFYAVDGIGLKSGKLFYFNTSYPASVPNAAAICAGLGLNATEFKIIYNDPAFPNDPTKRLCKKTKLSGATLNAAYDENYVYVPHEDDIIAPSNFNSSNAQYESVEAKGMDLSKDALLAPRLQNPALHPTEAAAAGILSTRSYGVYYNAGTNRAAFAFAMKNFMCKEMEEIHDNTLPDYRNRRDVDRNPGGDPQMYKNRCIGCHAGMDAMSGAFAYYDFKDGKLQYTHGSVVPKMNHNVLFTEGYITVDDSWLNLWPDGHNRDMGWGGEKQGHGLASLGKSWSETEAFHTCMSKRVYEKVCMRKASTAVDKERIAALTAAYKSNNYNMKTLFVDAASVCLED